MSALVSRSSHSSLHPPSDAERRQAFEASRQLAQTAVVSEPTNDATAQVVVQVKGRDVGEPFVIPLAALRLLQLILAEMGQGNAVMLTPVHAELTSQEAADLLNVSRPYMIKLLDEKTIPHRKVGKHRRVQLADVMDYKLRTYDARSAALDELAAQAQELNLGY